MNNTYNIQKEVLQIISATQARLYRIIPKERNDLEISLFIDKQGNKNGVAQELGVLLGKKITLFLQDAEWIDDALKKNYPLTNGNILNTHRINIKGDKEILVRDFILEANSLGSSDIHFESQEELARIRYRIDGHLLDKYIIPKNEYPALVNTIKIKANLDIAEKRLPQDGRIYFESEKKKLDIRVSIVPTINGEKIVFRLLNKDTSHIDLTKIGFSSEQLQQYKNSFNRSHGLILISGPTGSGKTTTLYATLKELNSRDRNILTIEDPIEYTMEGINQVQLKESIGLTFPIALRTFLRQDPDIIMVGEIRDPETANIAIRAALTGHLVLSTIHTNSAWGIVSRLTDMGIPQYLIAGTLNVAAAQRLIRLLCPSCKKITQDKDALSDFYFPNQTFAAYKPLGCEQCQFTGYKGRKAIFEVIEIDSEFRTQIKQNETDIMQIIKQRKIQSLTDKAKEIHLTGDTSFSEILPLLLNA